MTTKASRIRETLLHSAPGAVVCNLLLAMVLMMVTRVAFLLENRAVFGVMLPLPVWRGGLVFDLSAVLYVNALYMVLTLLPWHVKERWKWWNSAMRWLFVVTNGVALASNLVDSVYFQYTGRRSTVTVFSEFASEDNIASIILTEFVNHWYLVLLMAALVWLLWRCFTRVRTEVYPRRWKYYATQLVALVVGVPLTIIGIRGSATAGTRPITVSNANQYVSRPIESAVVLNTPFSMIRSIGKKVFVTPDYMPLAAMEREYTPVQSVPQDSVAERGRERRYNVVILIVESMSKEYIGSMNRDLDGGRYRGYMPFVDSLASQSMTFRYSYANGRVSMDAMPSILCGLPMMVEPYFLTPASLNDVEGLPAMLGSKGYHSAFFHGGHNISMGFSAFAHAIGYNEYYGLDEYCSDNSYGGMDDFDGKWAIWDEPFLQFTLDRVNTFREPFLATVFTASSHHPFNLPEKYRGRFAEGTQPIHKTVRYTDHALRRFFARASREPWFRNTIFVLVADHTNQATHREYLTDLGLYSVPIIFYCPDGSIAPGERDDIIAQQTDITPTLLHLTGYDRPYLAFGTDLLSTPPDSTWAFNYNNGIYQYCRGPWLMQFDGERVKAMYRFRDDPLLRHNLAGHAGKEQADMERRLKALIQQYLWRMNENRLLP